MKPKYVQDEGMTLTERVAHYLDWNAAHHPKHFVQYNELLKVILNLPRLLSPKAKEVEHLRKRMQRVKETLRDNYSRELISVVGYGVRASVSDVDKLEKVVPKQVTRLESARKSLVATVTMMSDRNIPAAHPLRSYFTKQLQPLLDKVNDPAFAKLTKALPADVADIAKGAPTNKA